MRIIKLFLLILISYTMGNAQIFDPVSWTFKAEQVEGNQYKLVFHAEIDPGWNIYSQFLDDGGPVPTSFTFDGGNHFETIGEITESDNAKSAHDPIFDMQVTKFTRYADFSQIVRFSDLSKPVSGYLTFMTCDDERCLPPKDVEFSILAAGSGKDGAAAETVTEDAQGTASAEEGPGISVDLDGSGISLAAGGDLDGIEQPVTWHFDISKVSDTEYDLVFRAEIDKGWQVYSKDVPEGGPWPTKLFFDESAAFEIVGQPEEEGAKREEGYDRIFEMNLVKFKGEATWTQRIKAKSTAEIITGEVEYMTCDDEKCIGPLGAEFSFDLAKQLAGGAELKEALAPGSMAGVDPAKVIDNRVATLQETYQDPIGDCGEEENAAGKGLFTTFLLGFVGGLLALLTPCVFPMIPLTVSFFTKDTRRKGWMNGALYGLSIVVIYVSLGVLLTVVFGPDVLNRLSTSWIANSIFFLIFMFFAFSFFGFYEITLPSGLANRSDSMADKGGLIGIFFMAFTLAVVSFSCTGPIIGSALVAATSKGMLGPAIVMFGFALALAIPFGLFAAFPAWLNSLPKSGGWMNSVKVMLGFLEVALAFKFLSVADMTSHWGFLRYELFMAIWVLVAAGMALYMFGIIRFPHDSPVKKLNATRWVFGLGMTAIAIYLASGFMLNEKTQSYDALKAMSGLAPPANYNFFIEAQDPDPSISVKYPSFSKCANNLDCFKDYYEGVSYAREVGKPILLDFTGYGCVNCRKTEEHIWIKDEVWNRISNDYVLVSLYVDDRMPLDEELYLPSSKRPVSYIGKVWTNFQEVNFQQNSQPLYVLVSPEEEVLAKPRGYKPDAKSYLEFLECGLETFEEHRNSQLLGIKE